MSSYTTSSSTGATLPTVKEVEAMNRTDVKDFLNARRAELDLEDGDIDNLYDQKVKGVSFLKLNYKMLVKQPFSIPGGPAVNLEKLINRIQGGKQASFLHALCYIYQ